ncbi:MAG: outer membrane protein assembly factor [Rhodobacteraceae bacterium]|jgi:translocation and assembly module TamA|uniref:autotransporter assembly complex protein TamA n=1 Tax=Albidovulum sp. TaxID=1872424 RepID=UPI001D9FD195|nr:autotransporter assembly complex family protein [uncultured Defluviimonas sp.]MCB2126853.1 outer membrane protein assembly factor [Paracoccaceae bacterium]MCC0070837.1 outer membrane protein assembly factor [Paracoccaceae bacterium]
MAIAGAALVVPCRPAGALDRVELTAPGADRALLDRLRAASLTIAAERDKTTDSQTIFAAARADYARLIGALYAEGYYSGVIQILIDGREAAEIAPLDTPESIGVVSIRVTPGPIFRFERARMRPYARGTRLPPAYGDTRPAYSTAIVDAAEAGVAGWRAIGHAKARVAGQSITADHAAAAIFSEILLAPGPRLRFGQMRVSGYERMRLERILKIAGFPAGEVFDPAKLDKVAARLRRTGVFRTVAVTEADTIGPGDTLDVELVLDEEKLRRFGFGAEVSNSEGLSLSGYWLHRNLLGGAERLRVDGSVERIGGQSGAIDYSLGVRIDRPATPVTDATAFVEARASREELLDQTVERVALDFGLSRVFGDHFTAQAGIGYLAERVSDAGGQTDYRVLTLPVALTWDSRDNVLDAHQGFYLRTELTPFLGYASAGSGAQVKADARLFHGFGTDDRVVLAGRLQLGTVIGPTLPQTPASFRFWSGGGGTVRGQPYQSLGVALARSAFLSVQTGGMSFAGASAELRASITDTIGAAAFYDAGYVGIDELFGGTGRWHAGAGLGLRYNTGIGPIRIDVAMPVSGPTGDGVQIYVGLGQAF